MAEVPLEVSVREAQRRMTDPGVDLRVIDVREPDEYALCRLPGAELIPLSELPSVAGERLPNKGVGLLVYCHHGMRSLQAVNILRQRGYPGAQSLAGGIEQWALEIDPAVRRY